MGVKIEFDTDNADFADCGRLAIYNILKDILEKAGSGLVGGLVRDSNGNTIGSWRATVDAEPVEGGIARARGLEG